MAISLCPKCGRRPRRVAGQKCLECEVEGQRAYRERRRNGVPQARRVRAVEEHPTRFTRPLAATTYIITSAQNATPLHEEFFECLKVAAKHKGAELVVIPFRYKNPTSIWSRTAQSNDWWGISPRAEAQGEQNPLAPYLFNTRKKLCANLVLAADVKMQPTASSPLSGFEALTGQESCIIGHPKMQFRAVSAPSGKMPKILSTTGALTRRNYTDTKAGKLGAFHHFLGAVVVDVVGKEFHLRQINADRVDGSFTDLDVHYTAKGPRKAARAAGLICGDLHDRFTDAKVKAATFGPGGIVAVLDPEEVVVHDLLDGYAVNPHHFGDPFIALAKSRAHYGNVREEVEAAIKTACEIAKGRRTVIAASNHDDFLARWLRSTDWRNSPGNAEFYLQTVQAVARTARITAIGAEYADPFRYWVNRLKAKSNVKALKRDESFKILGVECSLHGHRGPNGARATMTNLARIGARTVTGHAHSPGIEEGHYRVGTSTPLRLEYTSGPSSWLQTHCVIYATGKRALITIVNGNWRAPKS